MADPLNNFTDPIRAYFELVRLRPELFTPCEKIPLVLDEQRIRSFAQTQRKPMGVVFNNAPHYYVLADLCTAQKKDAAGQEYTQEYRYARVVYTDPDSNGAVAVVKCGGSFGLVTHFRHAPRVWSLEFPRGFSDTPGLTPEENVKKELCEEIGVAQEQCRVRLLGQVRADTGLSAGLAQVFLTEISSADAVNCTQDEGISRFDWVSEEHLLSMIAAGEITDGFTLSAYTLYAAVLHRKM